MSMFKELDGILGTLSPSLNFFYRILNEIFFNLITVTRDLGIYLYKKGIQKGKS